MNGGRTLLLLLLLLLLLKPRIDHDLITKPAAALRQLFLKLRLQLRVNMDAVAIGMCCRGGRGSELAQVGDVNAVSLVLMAAGAGHLTPPAPEVGIDQDAGGATGWRRLFLWTGHAVQILLVALCSYKKNSDKFIHV